MYRILVLAIVSIVALGSFYAMFQTTESTGKVPNSTGNGKTLSAQNYASVHTSLQEQSILNAVKNLGIPSQYVYLPNINAPNLSSTDVTMLYARSPAPMGITDYGLMEPSGFYIPYNYNSSGFLGTVKFEGVKPYYAMNNHPNSLSTQLSVVLSDVTIKGKSGNDFWIKSVMYYTPATSDIQFISNIWDLSSSSMVMPGNAILSGNGQTVPGLFYYYASPAVKMSGDFTTSLYVDSVIMDGNNAVTFKYQFTNEEQNFTGNITTFDTVVFNSAASQYQPVNNAVFQVNGFKKTPSGLLYDAELVVTGPGSGSTTTIYGANGQLTLKFKDAYGTYMKLPASYNYGSNTGETIQGLSVWWSSQMRPFAHLSLGPSLLVSLWGSQISHSGAVNIQGTINPPNSFVFMSIGTTFDNNTAAWAPIKANGTYKFSMPGRLPYSVMVMMSNYEPRYFTVMTEETINETGEEGAGGSHGGGHGGGGSGGGGEEETAAWYNVTLDMSLSKGIYTPLYASSNSQVKYLTVGSSDNGTFVGNGTAYAPYVIENNHFTNLNQLFTHTNYFMFPEFSGMLFMNTNSRISIVSPGAFQVSYVPSMFNLLDEFKLPHVNNLNMIFSNTSGITVSDAQLITGWFSSTMLGAPAASLMFYESTDFMVLSNTFRSMGTSLLVYNGVNTDANGTIWGNYFLMDHVTHSQYSTNLAGAGDPSAISVFSSGNLIYNNYFTSGVSAQSPGYDKYTGNASVSYHNDWNLSEKQNLSYFEIRNGYNLTGSIVDCSYQGGNFWDKQIVSLPYNSSGKIAIGGDYIPLIPTTYNATFITNGLPSGIGWSVSIDGGVPVKSSIGAITLHLQNGTHYFRIGTPSNYSSSLFFGTLSVKGTDVEQNITFTHVLYSVNFVESGLPAGYSWSVSLAGDVRSSSTKTVSFIEENGTYSYSVAAILNYTSTPASSDVLVYGSDCNVTVLFQYSLHKVSVQVNGLQNGGSWSISLSGQNHTTSSSSISFYVGNGLYSYEITPPDEFVASPSTGTLLILDGDATLAVTLQVKTYEVHFQHDGMPSGKQWTVEFGEQNQSSTSSVITFTVPAGNYSYTILTNGEYSSPDSTGYVQVNEDGKVVLIHFTSNPDYLGDSMILGIGAAIGLVSGIGLSLMLLRRR